VNPLRAEGGLNDNAAGFRHASGFSLPNAKDFPGSAAAALLSEPHRLYREPAVQGTAENFFRNSLDARLRAL